MGEYDVIGQRRKVGSQPPSGEFTPPSRKPNNKRVLVRPPVEWLYVGLALLVAAPVPILITSFSAPAFLASYGLVFASTLVTVLALLEDQKRMRAPSYSLATQFRTFGALLYSTAFIGMIVLIVLAAYRAASS